MSQTFLIGDLHLSHRNILKYRTGLGVTTTEEHDQLLVDNICSTTRKRDVLILTGDIAFDETAMPHLITIAKHVGGLKWILGNHDDHRVVKLALATIGNLSVHGCMSYKNTWITHIPMHESEFYRKLINIHGHLHSKIIEDERYFNSSADNINYKPVKFTDIIGGYRGELYNGGKWINQPITKE